MLDELTCFFGYIFRIIEIVVEYNVNKIMESCCIYYNNVVETKLISLTSLSSWKTLLDAAYIRNNTRLVELCKELGEGEFPNVKYHKTCRSMSTLKRDLDNLQEQDEVTVVTLA